MPKLCCGVAEYRYCAKDLSDLKAQVENTQIENRKNEHIEIYITLKGVRTKIMFTPRHFLALQMAFRVFKEYKKTSKVNFLRRRRSIYKHKSTNN